MAKLKNFIPFHPIPEYTEMQRVIYEQVCLATAGEKTVDQASTDAKSAVHDLFESAGYYGQ